MKYNKSTYSVFVFIFVSTFVSIFFSPYGFSAETLDGLPASPSEAFDIPSYSKDFENRWKCEENHPTACVSPETIEEVQKKQVLFTPGYLNELAYWPVGYYRSNIKAVMRDFNTKATMFRKASSWKPISQNAQSIYNEILKTFRKNQKPIILIGHSKGGAEALYTVLDHPNLIFDGIVDRVVLIQAAVNGSPLASIEKPGMAMRAAKRILGSALSSLSAQEVKSAFAEAKKTFKDYINTHFDENLYAEKEKLVSDKIFYVRSYEELNHFGFGVKLVLGVSAQNMSELGLNDGILLTADQKLDWIGVDLGVFQIDHTGFTLDGVNNFKNHSREAFTRALLQQIHDPHYYVPAYQ